LLGSAAACHECFILLVNQNGEDDKDLDGGLVSAECYGLALIYKDDVVADELVSELSHFQNYCHNDTGADSESETLGAAERYSLMVLRQYFQMLRSMHLPLLEGQ
jgi:hypothetical protein